MQLGAPLHPDNADSLVYRLWKKHRGTINPNMLPVDPSSKLLEALRKKYKELVDGQAISPSEVKDPSQIARGTRISRKSRERILKMYPQLAEKDLDSSS